MTVIAVVASIICLWIDASCAISLKHPPSVPSALPALSGRQENSHGCCVGRSTKKSSSSFVSSLGNNVVGTDKTDDDAGLNRSMDRPTNDGMSSRRTFAATMMGHAHVLTPLILSGIASLPSPSVAGGATTTKPSIAAAADSTPLEGSTHQLSLENDVRPSPFVYSDSWTGTTLRLQSLPDAVSSATKPYWAMGRWPDPILRRPAAPVDPSWFGTPILMTAANLLRQTALKEGAVGLAAQQCGVDARIIYLRGVGWDGGRILVNPRIVARSPEHQMKVWREECLVLPPSFRATVLRDDWVDVRYQTVYGKDNIVRLTGEGSRCLQHELDHDRGILILDHVSLEEMENDVMRRIESDGHNARMIVAYARGIASDDTVS